MEDSRFFKTVWRINGLLILIGFLLAALGMAFILYESFFKARNPYQPEVVESIAPDPEGLENWVIGNPIEVYGHNYSLYPLVSENKEVQQLSLIHI